MSAKQDNRDQASNSDKFTKKWRVLAGCPLDRTDPHQCEVEIVKEANGSFTLKAATDGCWRVVQRGLVYNADSETLENGPGTDPERRIGFWPRRDARRAAIFAMRIGRNQNPPEPLPHFEAGENGSWGAEEGHEQTP